MELHWAWYALAIVGAYRMIAVCFEAVVRRTVRIARQSAAEPTPHRLPPVIPNRAGAPPFDRVLSTGTDPAEGWGQP